MLKKIKNKLIQFKDWFKSVSNKEEMIFNFFHLVTIPIHIKIMTSIFEMINFNVSLLKSSNILMLTTECLLFLFFIKLITSLKKKYSFNGIRILSFFILGWYFFILSNKSYGTCSYYFVVDPDSDKYNFLCFFFNILGTFDFSRGWEKLQKKNNEKKDTFMNKISRKKSDGNELALTFLKEKEVNK
jgi:hypothetical protein